MPIRFSDYEIDEKRFLLRFRGRRIAMRPKVFDLLVLLVRTRERVVLRDELVLALWGTTAVGPGSLSGLVNELRQALGEAGRDTSSIRTVHARGYQFVAIVDSPGADGPDTLTASVVAAHGDCLAGRLASIRASFGRVGATGARAVLLAGASGSSRAALLESGVDALQKAGFEIVRSTSPPPKEASASRFVDQLLEALVDHYAIAALRGLIPARSHELFERCVEMPSPRVHWLSDPLAARQYEERIQRSAAELLRTLARERPIAFVFDLDEVNVAESASALSTLLSHLEKSPVFMLGTIASPVRDDPKIDYIEMENSSDVCADSPIKARDRLTAFLAVRGIAALPRFLTDALVAHVGDDETSLDSIAMWLCAELGSNSLNSNGSIHPVRSSRMRRVEPHASPRRSGLEIP